MVIYLSRYGRNQTSTGGALSEPLSGFFCHTVEDEFREIKIPGETRIPAGKYEIKLRTSGGMHSRYSRAFPWHSGMLHLQNVPGFKWIYIHPGRNEKQTDGCILVGYTALSKNGFALDRSLEAYKDLCDIVYPALLNGEKVYIHIKDNHE